MMDVESSDYKDQKIEDLQLQIDAYTDVANLKKNFEADSFVLKMGLGALLLLAAVSLGVEIWKATR